MLGCRVLAELAELVGNLKEPFADLSASETTFIDFAFRWGSASSCPARFRLFAAAGGFEVVEPFPDMSFVATTKSASRASDSMVIAKGAPASVKARLS